MSDRDTGIAIAVGVVGILVVIVMGVTLESHHERDCMARVYAAAVTGERLSDGMQEHCKVPQ